MKRRIAVLAGISAILLLSVGWIFTGGIAIILNTSYAAARTFEWELPIAFREGTIVRCEVVVEFVGAGTSRKISLVRVLQGRAIEIFGTNWERIASC